MKYWPKQLKKYSHGHHKRKMYKEFLPLSLLGTKWLWIEKLTTIVIEWSPQYPSITCTRSSYPKSVYNVSDKKWIITTVSTVPKPLSTDCRLKSCLGLRGYLVIYFVRMQKNKVWALVLEAQTTHWHWIRYNISSQMQRSFMNSLGSTAFNL